MIVYLPRGQGAVGGEGLEGLRSASGRFREVGEPAVRFFFFGGGGGESRFVQFGGNGRPGATRASSAWYLMVRGVSLEALFADFVCQI